MESIVEPNQSFDFTKLSLAHPSGVQGGAYFTKFLYNNKPLYIQTTKGQTRQGFVKSGKKHYCDLMFDNNASELINWCERLEESCQSLLYSKNEAWFQGSLEKSDIDNAFTPTIRVYKSGKYYLLRTNIATSSSGDPSIKIYSENEIPLATTDVKNESQIISILEFQGIKFTSRNFQIEIVLKQIMVLDEEPTFDNCLIKTMKRRESLVKDQELIVEPQVIEPQVIEPQETQSQETRSQETQSQETQQQETQPQVIESQETQSQETQSQVIEPQETQPQVIEPYTTIDQSNIDVSLDIEELDTDVDIKEINELNVENGLETFTLKKPNEVYFELYREARTKAKQAKKAAIIAYLEAKNIKKTYMLDELNESDSDFDAEIEDVSESELDGL